MAAGRLNMTMNLVFRGFFAGSIDAKAAKLIFIEGDAEAGAVRHPGSVRIEGQRLA